MIEQIVVCICSVAGVFLSQDTRFSRRRYACVFGLISQPFWFYITWKAGQYGIFSLGFLYLFSWLRGFYVHWAKPWLESRRPAEPDSCPHGFIGNWSDDCPDCRH